MAGDNNVNSCIEDSDSNSMINTEYSNKEILTEVLQVHEDISYLKDLFVRRLNDDKQKNAVIQRLADGATYAFVEPFVYDIILLLDRLEKSDDDFVLSVKEELYSIINRRGVEIIEVNKEFDPALHKVIKVIEDADADALYISSVIRNGYTFSGKVVRPAEVIVCKPINGES